MKKFLIKILITIIFVLTMSCCEKKNHEIRLRILANDNTEIAQEHKLEVRTFLKEYLKQIEIVNMDIKYLEKILNDTFAYDIKVERKKVNYEAKSLDNKLIPSGSYDTILITIGNGKGKNFWTLLYPEYFSISFEENNEVEYKSYFYELFFNSYIY